MARTPKEPKAPKASKKPAKPAPAKRLTPDGKATTAKPPRTRAAVQASLPNVPDGRIAKLEELDAERTEALRDSKASRDLAADVERRMIGALEEEAKKSGRDRYKTNSGFVIAVKVKKSLDRKRVPKAKARKGQAVPTGVAS